jgi:hypothetical protein
VVGYVVDLDREQLEKAPASPKIANRTGRIARTPRASTSIGMIVP